MYNFVIGSPPLFKTDRPGTWLEEVEPHEKLHDALSPAREKGRWGREGLLLILSRFPGLITPEVVSNAPREELPCGATPFEWLFRAARNFFSRFSPGRALADGDTAPANFLPLATPLVFHSRRYSSLSRGLAR